MANASNSDNEHEEFAALVGPVKRHRDERARLSKKPRLPAESLAYRRLSAAEEQPSGPRWLADEDATEDPEAPLAFAAAGVSARRLRQLKRGQPPWNETLDLHGCRLDQAPPLLTQLLARARQRNENCVRIIHGKGIGREPAPARLKSAVSLWLRRHPQVLAFVSARPMDGGTGALYVLLRRPGRG